MKKEIIKDLLQLNNLCPIRGKGVSEILELAKKNKLNHLFEFLSKGDVDKNFEKVMKKAILLG